MSIQATVERVWEQIEAQQRKRVVAFVLPLPEGELPSAVDRLTPDTIAVVMTLDKTTRRDVVKAIKKNPAPRVTPELVVIELRGDGARAAWLSATGQAFELAVFGTRGEGKTWLALAAFAIHARLHAAASHPLPTRIMAVTDAHTSHKAKTCRSMQAPEWAGAWTLRDDQHVAVFISDGVEWTALDLIGLADMGAMDKVRAEAHGLWTEEPAPAAVMDTSSGVSLDAFLLAITSCRLASHANPKLITSNYPDADHWTWQRFAEQPAPRRVCIRIKPGEWAGEQQRAEWREALKDRPDILRRLLEGEPGVVQLGAQVAVGFNLAKLRLKPTSESRTSERSG